MKQNEKYDIFERNTFNIYHEIHLFFYKKEDSKIKFLLNSNNLESFKEINCTNDSVGNS